MCLTEYDEAKTMRLFKEEGREEGIKEGREEGIKEGREELLVRQICRKLRKGKPPDLITEELEEDISVVKPICEKIAGFAPDFDEEKAVSAFRDRVL